MTRRPSRAAHRELYAYETRRRLRDLCRRQHVLLAGRGTTALWAALTALELRGRSVWLPANTCYTVLWAVLLADCRPLLVDIDPATGNLTTVTLDAALAFNGEPPAAIIPCHLYGFSAPIGAITAWARAHGAFVIEDAALAAGAVADGRPAGAWGDAAIFSFGGGKIIDGDNGGALVTDDAALAQAAAPLLDSPPLWDAARAALERQWLDLYWALHQHDADQPALAALYRPLFALYADALMRYRLPRESWRAVAAALADLPDQQTRRVERADTLDNAFAGSGLTPIARPAGSTIWRYPLLAPQDRRDDLLRHWWANGLHETTRWYPSLRPMAAALAPGIPQPPTPAADRWGAQIVNLPLDIDPGRAASLARELLDDA